jgi:group I intron endonuclease
MFQGYIYKINNLVNSKFYIGQTRNSIRKRLSDHKYASRKDNPKLILYSAIKKYGEKNFNIEILETIQAETKEELIKNLNEREIYTISSLKPEYNIAAGGLGNTGVVWTEERKVTFKEKMSGANNHNYNKPLSEETKQKLSKALKGRVISSETREKISQTMKGVSKSESTKAKMKEASKNKTIKFLGSENKKSKSVDQFNLKNEFVKTFSCIREAADELQIQKTGICLCCQGKLKSSGNFIWRYHNIV